jgi:protoporphyrinogen oxidase
MKIAIVGAGLTGLTSGFLLSEKGCKVSVFEKDDFLGGLVSGFKAGDWYLEKFYHHIFKSDEHILNLCERLGIGDIWFWKDCGAPIFYKGKMYPFSTPQDLLRFSPLSLPARLQTGTASLFLKLFSDFKRLEGINGWNWLQKWMGQESFKIIWQPLLEKKFGKFAVDISLTWIWARIHKRSRFLGYPKGGFQVILDKLAAEIKENKGEVKLKTKVSSFSELKSYDKVIFTGSNLQFLKFARFNSDYKKKLEKINYLGSVVALFFLKKPLTDWVYWLNINDSDIPFVGLVQHSNLADSRHYNNLHPVYLTTYVSKDNKLFSLSDEEIILKWQPFLKKVNSSFKKDWVKEVKIFKEFFTQPVLKTKDYKFIPEIKTPLKNVYLANTSQVYPWDRGTNYSVELGKRTVEILEQDN